MVVTITITLGRIENIYRTKYNTTINHDATYYYSFNLFFIIPLIILHVAPSNLRSCHDIAGYPLHRENRENGQNNSLSGKTQGIWKFCQNIEILVCSSCKFPDSKGKRYFDICRENSQFFLEAGYVY